MAEPSWKAGIIITGTTMSMGMTTIIMIMTITTMTTIITIMARIFTMATARLAFLFRA